MIAEEKTAEEGLSEERVEELGEKLPWTYFVGVGYWPSPESFALGIVPRPDLVNSEVNSSNILDHDISLLSPKAPRGWELIFFRVGREWAKERITKEDAIWLLDHMAHY